MIAGNEVPNDPLWRELDAALFELADAQTIDQRLMTRYHVHEVVQDIVSRKHAPELPWLVAAAASFALLMVLLYPRCA